MSFFDTVTAARVAYSKPTSLNTSSMRATLVAPCVATSSLMNAERPFFVMVRLWKR